MTEVVSPARRVRSGWRRRGGSGWRLRLLVAVAVLITAFTVVAVVETLHFSSAQSSSVPSLGFYVPKSSTPVAFSLPSLTPSATGPRTSLSDLLGKPVVLNLWASTCDICMSETPAFEGVARAVGDQVSFVGIDTADVSRRAAVAFAHRYGVTYRQLYDPGAAVFNGYGLPGLPVTVFVSSSGKVKGINIGALSAKSLQHYLTLLFGVST